MRRKCVSGSACESHCAGRGMASNGNMKPLRRMFGRRKKKDICIACCCVCASVEKNEADGEVRGDEEEREREEERHRPADGHVEDDAREAEDERHLHVADGDVRKDLPDHELEAGAPARR